MKFASKSAGGTIEILAIDIHKSIPITVAEPTAEEGETADPVVKAGTPLKADGTVTTGADAVGILLYDVDTSANPNGAAVVSGIIDATKAQAHSGVTYSVAALKTAVPGVTLRTNIGVNS